jgi:Icc-related predicted phosphoesterase
VLCGHIHQPAFRQVTTPKGNTLYLNSGDWIENLTALEYVDGNWNLYHHPNTKPDDQNDDEELNVKLPNMEMLYKNIIQMPNVAFTSTSKL